MINSLKRISQTDPLSRALESLTYLTSTAADGNFSFHYDKTAQVIKFRQQFLKKHDQDLKNCVVMSVQDKAVIKEVTKKDLGKGTRKIADGVKADILVTKETGLLLFLLTADCLPLTIFDPTHQVVALAHLGRKSTDQELATKLIKYLQKKHGSAPQDLIAILGPSIGSESYLLEPDKTKLQTNWGENIIQTESGKISLDLSGFVSAQLLAQGLLETHLIVSPVDTATDPTFFSHYRSSASNEPEGRFATVVGVKSE